MRNFKTIFEHQSSKNIDNFYKLTQKDILEIEKLNQLSKANIFDIQANNHIKANQFVGIVKINNKNIQILPKIFGDNNEKIIENLLYMLAYTKKLKIKQAQIAKMGKIDDLFEVFVYIFVLELLDLLKKEFKKNYHNIEENSSFLKGKLLFTKHLKNNLFNKAKFFVEYEKMDENFLLNIFLKSTCHKLLKYSKSAENKKLLKRAIFIMQDVEDRIFTNSNILEKIKFTRHTKNYKNVFSLAKMLYFGNSPDFSGNKNDNFSILFDMNKLFEEFIGEFLKQNIDDFENIEKLNLQVQNKYIFKENKFKLKPDILLTLKNGEKIIIDTKYKKLDKSKNYDGVSQADIYQMFAYGIRYLENQENKKIILLYPDYDGKNYNQVFKTEENIEIFIKTISLNYDLKSEEGKKKLKKELEKILAFSFNKN